MIRVATAVALLALGLVSKTNLGETHWATIVVFIAAYLVAGYDVLCAPSATSAAAKCSTRTS